MILILAFMAHCCIESGGFLFCGGHGVCGLLFGAEHLRGWKDYASLMGLASVCFGCNFKQILQLLSGTIIAMRFKNTKEAYSSECWLPKQRAARP